MTDEALLAAMLRVEVALAQAQADLGLISTPAAAAIARHAGTFGIAPADLARNGAHAGSIAIPFVKALTAHVAAQDAGVAAYVHYGATSQDVIDTALALCLQPAETLIDEAMQRAQSAAMALAAHHADTPVLARTLMQPAGVITIGFKAAHWALSLARVRERLRQAARDACAVSLGGATGALPAFGDHCDALRAALAGRLGLRDPGACWHTRREDLAALASAAAIACGVMTKIARDLSLMMQAEVGEAREPVAQGRGGSTAMPHKRNPVLCLRVLACTQPAPGIVSTLLAGMAHEHERALGDWQAELGQYRALFDATLGAALPLADLLEGVTFDSTRCRANIEATGGLVFSETLAALLIPSLGRDRAQRLVGELCFQSTTTGRHLRELATERLAAEPTAGVTREQVEAAFDLGRAARPAARQARALVASTPLSVQATGER